MRLPDRPRPGAASSIGDRMKVHRRTLRAGGRDYTVISPRAGADVRFSTNFFHGTWHILSDWRGARMLGRLLWGLAFTKVPGTVVMIDRPLLDPNPFDGEAAAPVILVPALLTPLTHKTACQLRHALPHAQPAGTVRWDSHGLDAEVAAQRQRPIPGAYRPPYIRPPGPERMAYLGGFVSFSASPELLRANASYIYRLCENATHESAYTEVDWPNGEVQIFRDYRRRVSATLAACREIHAEPDAPRDADQLHPLIWSRAEQARHGGRFRPFPAPVEPQATVRQLP